MKRVLFSVLASCLLISMLAGCADDIIVDSGDSDTEPFVSDSGTEFVSDSITDDVTDEDEKKDEDTDGEVKEKVKFRFYSLHKNEEYFKYNGRMQHIADGVSCDFTASGIEFSGIMKGDLHLLLECSDDTYFTVFVDGVRQNERIFANKDTKRVKIATFAGEAEHSVRIIKQSEAQRSISLLKAISMTGYLYEAPKERDYFIEVIGDSITCGYGNLGTKAEGSDGTALWEDGTQAFPFLTAEALGADCSVIGCSGIGVQKGYSAVTEKDFYIQWCRYRNTNNPYNFKAARVPDIVVINLGTNDKSTGATEAEFKTEVKYLINYVRTAYGQNVPVIWTYNMMGNGCFDWVKPVLAEMGGESAGLYYVELNQNQEGGGGHPLASAHKTAANTLSSFIRTKNILK